MTIEPITACLLGCVGLLTLAVFWLGRFSEHVSEEMHREPVVGSFDDLPDDIIAEIVEIHFEGRR